MISRLFACVTGVTGAGLILGCSSPFDRSTPPASWNPPGSALTDGRAPDSRFRAEASEVDPALLELDINADPDAYVRYAMYNSPEVEAAYQRWLAASERMPQVRALPDPRLSLGFFLDEVETRTGAQQARVGLQQTLPWPGKLQDRKDAAAQGALAAWRGFEAARLAVTERVVATLHELAYLDAAIRITQENFELLRSIEEVARARYRVGAGSHPELIRAQVELGLLEDRIARLVATRPAYIAELNAAMNRDASSEVPSLVRLPVRVVDADAAVLADLALEANPTLLALRDRAEQQRILGEVARKDGLPDLTVGVDYLVTNNSSVGSLTESGDDPILLNFGVNLPIWREKYDAAVRETIARRLAISHEREDQANRISAAIHRAWFEHTDADRRVRLYERTLIPKAEESLRASLGGFRTGDTTFLEVLDTERTLLEFAVASERARADRGAALARINTLVGRSAPTLPAEQTDPMGGQP